jgi:ATP-dependent 26S proteasome regulatory subunit
VHEHRLQQSKWSRQKKKKKKKKKQQQQRQQNLRKTPAITQPMVLVMRNNREMVDASINLSSTFFCVITTHADAPRTAIAVSLSFTALNAYST